MFIVEYMNMRYNQSSMENISSHFIIVLSSFMVILLTGRAINVDGTEKGVLIMIMYSLVLTCIGIIIGINLTKIYSIKKQINTSISQHEELSTSVSSISGLSRFNSSEQFIINYLLDNGCKCWQSDLVKKSNMTDSKISRSLTKLEASGIISRVRDGMGKRVNLHKVEIL